jgi:alcohol dehydrogenase (NADP+)
LSHRTLQFAELKRNLQQLRSLARAHHISSAPAKEANAMSTTALPTATPAKTKTLAYAATSATSPLAPFSFARRQPLPDDIALDILFCGVCHSDLHTARNEWTNTTYPVVPGHEIVGRVTAVGSSVTAFRPGDLAAVGCMVDSCHTCPSCRQGLEQYCEPGFTGTYNSPDPHLGGMTFGGYSRSIVVHQHFVLRIPQAFADHHQLPGVAPLLCAGITTYSPLKHWQVDHEKKVGIVGLGGLGHMGVKIAAAMGAHVVLFTTSPGKKEDGHRLGAREVVVSRNQNEMDRHAGSFHFILDTVSAAHDLNAYLNLLRLDGTLTLVGAPPQPPKIEIFNLIMRRRSLAGSLIGGIQETQEMLDFCAQHGLTADVELIPIQKINQAYDRMLRSDVKYRFVIDMESLK